MREFARQSNPEIDFAPIRMRVELFLGASFVPS
jgi:hypothetical protein